MTTIRPLKDQVLILPDPAPEKIGAIHVPQGVKTNAIPSGSLTGTVLGVGPKVADIAKLDKVAYPNHRGMEIRIDGVRHLLFKESEILAKL